ncbi:MAG: NCS2 family permease [Pseudomonadota bacterium]
MAERLAAYFEFEARGTALRRECVGGVTTFLTMAYIIFVNPAILSEAGMDPGAVFVATCLAAALGSLIMGLYANLPIAVAPGMGLNAFFTYGVVLGMGVPWQTALGAVFLSGCLFIALSLSPARERIIDAIPKELKLAISAGIGLFLIVIGLTSAGVIVDDPATLVGLGAVGSTPVLLAICGFLLIAALEARGLPGGVLIGVLTVTVVGAVLGLSEIDGLVALPPDASPTFLAMDLASAFDIALLAVILSFLFVDLFDTAGTLVGVAHRAGLTDAGGRIPGLKRALLADSVATTAGAAFGTSSVTSYVESAAGVRAGGRTGMTACVVAALFLLSLFLAPLAGSIEAYATGPALVFAGCMMMAGLADADWEDLTSAIPVVVTVAAMPLTYSIATGVGFGFIAFAALKALTGRWREASWGVYAIAALFLAKFAFLDAG